MAGLYYKIFTMLLLLCGSIGYSQTAYHEEVIQFNQGLPSDIVLKTQFDAKGFVYVVTPRGIARYDGYRFKNNSAVRAVHSFLRHQDLFYLHDGVHGLFTITSVDNKPAIISKNNYQDSNPNNDHYDNIFVDSKGRVWCSDFNYIKYFKGGKSKSFLYNPGNKTSGNSIAFCEPVQGEVWAFTANGLLVWKDGSSQLEPHPNQDLNTMAYSSAIKINSALFLAAADGRIMKYNIQDGLLTNLPNLPKGDNALGIAVHQVKGKSEPLLYSRNRIYRINGSDYDILYNLEKNQINHVLADAVTGILWVSTNRGLVKLSPVQGIREKKLPQLSDKVNHILAVVQDSKKVLWMIDRNNTLWSHKSGAWKKYTVADKTLQLNNVNIIDNKVIISASNGLYILEGEVIKKMPLPDFPNTQAKKCILTRNNELWILCAVAPVQRYGWPGLYKINDSFLNEEAYWQENQWNDIIENTDGKIWIAGWTPKNYGMNYYNPKRNRFIDIAELPFNRERKKFFGDYNTKAGLTRNGQLLFSGYGGFNRVEANGNINKKVDIIDYPIANGHIEGIADDSGGNVVFATADGLHVYNFSTDRVTRISGSDGLPTDDLVYGFAKTGPDAYALGVDNGFVEVDIKKILHPAFLNRLELTSVSVDGVQRTINGNHIELTKDENDLVLHFSNLSFSDKQKAFYRYRFTDEKHWNNLGNNPELVLNHITPGNYNLIIQAGNHMGDWQPNELNISVTAHPPFYRSDWFYVLAALTIVSLVLLGNNYLLRRQRKETQYKQKIKEAEMQTLRTQMNPHFMFNTLNSINSFIIENQPEAASEYLTTFSRLMRSILEYSKEEFISLENELRTLKFYLELEAVRLEHSFDYTFTHDDNTQDAGINIPPLILQPFVENAIWHGLRHKPDQGNLFINVSMKDYNKLVIRIEDDGIGREAAGKLKMNHTHHKSYGIEITKERLRMLNPENVIEIVDLKDESGSATGTAVIITIIL
ncbi:MAG: hypothetical protein EOO45_11760 [Flavobacterium sp.]|nr:MAG: hypothetical protein EOO45_11760 [Flavobacterium sp.]